MNKQMKIKAWILGCILIPLGILFTSWASAAVQEPVKKEAGLMQKFDKVIEIGGKILEYLDRDERRELR